VPAGGGVYMLPFPSTFTCGAFEGWNTVAPGLGLSRDQPTALALEPDGKLYVGYLNNGNIKRVTNPSQINPASKTQTVESVGTAPNGRSMRAVALPGPDPLHSHGQGSLSCPQRHDLHWQPGPAAERLSSCRMVTSPPTWSWAGDGAGKAYVSVAASVSVTPRPQTAPCRFGRDFFLSMGTPTRFRWTASETGGSEKTRRR